jgi:hypothetical protein
MDLAGCVNDARDWQSLLETRGYRVDLHDGEATALASSTRRHRSSDRPLMATRWCSCLPAMSWLPDANGDEPDARDEMMCTVDVMQEQYLLDDDLNKIFSTKRPGVRLYVIADCCHSGSVIRYAAPGGTPLKARFLPPYAFARGNVRLERAIDRAANAPAPAKHGYPALLFSGCQDSEFSYDASFSRRPNGVFTRTAIDVLQDAGITSPQAFHDAIRKQLPSQSYPQTPQLFGSRRHNWVLSSDP